MPRGRKNGRNTRRTPTRAVKSKKRTHSNPDDTAEPTAATTSHGEVGCVDGTVATFAKKKPCSQPKINLSSSLFSKIKETDHFVDKTKFIEVLFGDSPYILITKPRRCGKSTILDMVHEFVEKKVYRKGDKVGQEILRSPENDRAFPDMNLRLFEDGNFEISKWNEFSRHRGKYPTIRLNFLSINGDNYLQILLNFRNAITEPFHCHIYLLYCEDLWSTPERPDRFDRKKFENYLHPPTLQDMILTMTSEEILSDMEAHIEGALLFLVELLHKHFCHEIYLLIDEYDKPINNTIFRNEELCKKVNGLLTNLFKDLLKKQDNFIGRALITGISYMSSVSLSEVNNVKKHMFLRGELGGDDRYEVFYGITEEELEMLTTKFTEKFWQGVNKLPNKEVESYYKGYQSIGKSGVKIYPIWSIVKALKNGKLSDYWEQSGIMAGAREGLKIPIVRIAIRKLLAGESIKCEIPYKSELKHLQGLSDVILKWEENKTLLHPDVVLCFLLQQGYLVYIKEIDEDIFEVKIPNTLVKAEFRTLIREYVEDDYDKLIADVTEEFDQFPNMLSDAVVKRLIRYMQKPFEYVREKCHKSNVDAYYSVIFYCLSNSLKFKCCTELWGNKGRPDIAFMFKDIAIIIEVTHCKTALTAFQQIESKKYVKTLKENLPNENLQCICMGLNVDENNKVSICYKNGEVTGSPLQVFLKNDD